MNPYTLTLLRHGEIDHDGRLIGRTDLPLNEQGWAQLRASWQAISDTAPVTALATSPLLRCRAFAVEQALAAGLALKVDERFAECHFGDWDGAAVDALSAETPCWNARLVAGELDAPGGETLDVFRTRVLEGLAQWMVDARGSHRVLVAHAGVIAVILAELLDTRFSSARLIAVPRGGFVQLSMLDGHPAYLTRLEGPGT
ncbi:histidine phosphatase family protein [Crenobacter cavernae]|uniref:Histidine phosphatase family protein n=1 Tax=Crenobacter cavernae TaxID=2290923 RepID=A0A345Y584_9NEIS|nr:histidine phosphatase family protein [Crenobacter cavernae]AXK39086.1 histidine phosphatase family protein [Crenobacter cavernae]